MKYRSVLLGCILVFTYGISYAGPNLANVPPNKININPADEDFIYYPAPWAEIFDKTLPELVGQIVIIYNDPDNQNAATVQPLTTAITAAGISAIKQTDNSTDTPDYSSIITGQYSATLTSPLLADLNLNASTQLAYSLTVKRVDAVSLTPDPNFINKPNLLAAMRLIPSGQTFYGVYFVTGLETRTVSYTTYYQQQGGGGLGFMAINIGGKYFSSDELAFTRTFLVFTAVPVTGMVADEVAGGAVSPASPKLYKVMSDFDLQKNLNPPPAPAVAAAPPAPAVTAAPPAPAVTAAPPAPTPPPHHWAVNLSSKKLGFKLRW
jgi:hypothetical protein